MSDPEVKELFAQLAAKGVEIVLKVDHDKLLQWRAIISFALGFSCGALTCYWDMKSDVNALRQAVEVLQRSIEALQRR